MIGRRDLEREERRPRRKESCEDFSRCVEKIVERVRQLPVLDDRSPDAISGLQRKRLFRLTGFRGGGGLQSAPAGCRPRSAHRWFTGRADRWPSRSLAYAVVL